MKTHFSRTLVMTTALAVSFGASISQSPAQPMPSSTASLTTDANALPPSIQPTSPLAQVIRLVQAGVEESVILSYVSNSSSTFNLDSDKIIYLTDVGVPSEIATAMMQRDQILQQQMAAASPVEPNPSDTQSSTATYTTDATDATTPPPDSAPVTVNYFYTSLAPYGNWVDIAGYGRCWRPTVVVYNHNWQPYCDRGHWVNTDSGWYWESDYAWGTTFHYGRWFLDSNLGWCWWPDVNWAPSWVTWRYSDDYCGWAPLPPFAVWQPGIGFAYRGNGVSVGFDFGLNVNCFTFVPTRNFCDPHPRRYRCAPAQATQIYGRTTIINNINYHNRIIVNNGIPPQHFAGTGGAPIRQVPVREVRIPPNFSQHPGPVVFQNQRPATIAPGNPPGQNFDRDVNHANQNNLHQPVNVPSQNYGAPARIPQNYSPPAHDWSAPAPAPTPVRNYDSDRNFNAPQNNQPTPADASAPQRFNSPAPSEQRNDTPPNVNHFEPAERPPIPAPVDHAEPHTDSRPNSYDSPQRSAPVQSAPPAPSPDRTDKYPNGQNH